MLPNSDTLSRFQAIFGLEDLAVFGTENKIFLKEYYSYTKVHWDMTSYWVPSDVRMGVAYSRFRK